MFTGDSSGTAVKILEASRYQRSMGVESRDRGPPPPVQNSGESPQKFGCCFLHANKLSIFPKISPWAKSEEKLKCVDRSFSIFESVPLNQNFAMTPLDTLTSHKNCTPCHGLTVSLTYTLYTLGMKYSVPENNRNGLTD